MQNGAANADDVDGVLPDDEDGVLNPLDLSATKGTSPAITFLVTNLTENEATLSGWIDFNSDGIFDNTTERAQVLVPDDSNRDRFTLTFPEIPVGSAGATFARFRLSTDASAADSTGPAFDGEVEDYVFRITAPAFGVKRRVKLASGTAGVPELADFDSFGESVTPVGDIDGDGVIDIAVGADLDHTGGINCGAVHLLFLDEAGAVKASTKIADGTGSGPSLTDRGYFGDSVTGLGDLDGDGVPDIAVGTPGNGTNDDETGSVYVLFLNTDGTAKSSVKISDELNGGPSLSSSDFFGATIASLGDFDGDGITDLAIGATGDDTSRSNYGTGGSNSGAVYVLLLNTDGTVRHSTQIGHQINGGPTLSSNSGFGASIAALRDLDGDGWGDIAVGSSLVGAGQIFVLFMSPDGAVKEFKSIARNFNGGPDLPVVSGQFGDSVPGGNIGDSLSAVGDLNGDGVPDLITGTRFEDVGGTNSGAVFLLQMKLDGTAESSIRIDTTLNGGPTLSADDRFGTSVAYLGDLNGDGFPELAVGADGDDTGGPARGAVHLLLLNARFDFGDAPDGTTGQDSDADGVDDGVDLNPFDSSVATAAPSYNTRSDNNGPGHGIDMDLRLGTLIDISNDGLPGFSATGDASDNDLPSDEDGLVDTSDLNITAGVSSSVRMRVTNLTDDNAELFGWIGFNADGIFDNVTERTQVAVPSGTENQLFTLTFTPPDSQHVGTIYARFRLSTDPAAQHPTGFVADGEVEDHVVHILAPSSGVVKEFQKITHDFGAGPRLSNDEEFGDA